MVRDGSEAIDRRDVVIVQQAGPFNAFPNYMWDTWFYIIRYYFLMMRMNDIQIFCSMVLCKMLMWIWMKTMCVTTLLWPSVGVKPNTWKKWGFGVLWDSRMFRARQQGPKHLALRRSWCHRKALET
jgi:hypothetical protein